jgi:hypothetical protein
VGSASAAEDWDGAAEAADFWARACPLETLLGLNFSNHGAVHSDRLTCDTIAFMFCT